MKKSLLLVLIVLGIATKLFAGGIYEYKGRNYCMSLFGGAMAETYAIKQYPADDLHTIKPAIYNNRLYFIGLIAPLKLTEVVNRRYIQNGDQFILSDKNQNVLATYTGPKKEFGPDSYLILNQNCLGIGYATYGGAIIITEIVVNDEEYKVLEKNMKEIT